MTPTAIAAIQTINSLTSGKKALIITRPIRSSNVWAVRRSDIDRAPQTILTAATSDG